MQTVLEKQKTWMGKMKRNKHKIGFLTGLFGCRHKELTRPFTVEKNSHRSCSHCGAWRNFNPETLETYGDFYYPQPADSSQINLN